MKGWKTWAGAGVVGLAAAIHWFGYPELANGILMIGGAVLGIGIGHKIEKSRLPDTTKKAA